MTGHVRNGSLATPRVALTRRLSIALFAAVALPAAASRESVAPACGGSRCDCVDVYRPHGTLRGAVGALRDSADAVVVGTVIRIGPDPDGKTLNPTYTSPPVVARVQVTRRWKGPAHDTLFVRLHQSRERVTSCDYFVNPGERHLFVLREAGAGRFDVDACSGSLPLDTRPGETSPASRAWADSILAALGPPLEQPAVHRDATIPDTTASMRSGPRDSGMWVPASVSWIALVAARAPRWAIATGGW
jgi:hypothetical protein